MTPHREAAVRWAQETANDPSVVYLDTETTGLGDDAEIIDIAVIGNDGRVLLDSLVRPLRPIPAGASAVHGITDEMVKDAPPWRDVVPILAAVLTMQIVVVYNAEFDSKMIDLSTEPDVFPDTYFDWQCAMKAYSDFDGTPGKRGFGFRWWKLAEAAALFGIEPGGHRARADAEATRQVILKMASYSETPSEDEPVAVTVQPSLFAVETPVDAEKWRR